MFRRTVLSVFLYPQFFPLIYMNFFNFYMIELFFCYPALVRMTHAAVPAVTGEHKWHSLSSNNNEKLKGKQKKKTSLDWQVL